MQSAASHQQRASVEAVPAGFHLGAHLNIVEAFAAEALISVAARARLRALGSALPPFRHGIFECRLTATEPQVDFCCKYTARDLFDAVPPAADGLWRRLADLRQAWARPDSSIARAVDLLGLEFDLDQRVTAETAPSLFFAFSTDDIRASMLALDSIVERVQGGLDARWRDGLQRCADALTPGAHFNYAGLMLGREPGALRIGVEGLAPQSAIPDYLERIGWSGPVNALRAFLAGLPAPLQRSAPVVALDVGASIGGRVGLEFLLCHEPAVQEGRAQLLLDHLVGLGLCSPEKRSAVLRWAEAPPAAVSASPSWCDVFLRPASAPQLHRIVSHIKLSWTEGADVRAKVYLETTAAP